MNAITANFDAQENLHNELDQINGRIDDTRRNIINSEGKLARLSNDILKAMDTDHIDKELAKSIEKKQLRRHMLEINIKDSHALLDTLIQDKDSIKEDIEAHKRNDAILQYNDLAIQRKVAGEKIDIALDSIIAEIEEIKDIDRHQRLLAKALNKKVTSRTSGTLIFEVISNRLKPYIGQGIASSIFKGEVKLSDVDNFTRPF